MKNLPKILILGRPNVGKSTLINRLIHKNKAITLDTPGVTRDLISFPCEWDKKKFAILDSGGVLFEDTKHIYLQDKIDDMVKNCAEEATKIIFLTDYSSGLNPTDEHIANFLRNYKEKVVVAVNKIDNLDNKFDIGEFFKLGLGTPLPISAGHGSGVAQLLDLITKNFEVVEEEEAVRATYKVALVGRPNVGKSSLINALINEKRVIVDNVAGTTRDAIEIHYNYQGIKYLFTDTAGIRKKARIDDGIEYYSVLRSKQAIEEADLSVVLLDATYYLCEQDKKIINMVLDAHKPLILFVNKWDMTERTDLGRQDLERLASEILPPLVNYPFIFGSATSKINLGKLFSLIPQIIANSRIRISTGPLNKFLDDIIKKNPPPTKMGHHVKILYATQMETSPPKFLFFVNKPKVILPDYKRFLEKKIRTHLNSFEGVPLQLYFRDRQGEDKKKN